ncbi:MAG: M48 family metallopeptidase [Mesorhizobium sp.]|uniref:M48 family metallopeptidase n=1 Tax=Mesorhizobium sp. TaxID=1871066 RepID=UPI000FE6E3F0|nr:SprT family zinc-dependent metalloprotease [Mesorhizobium sp.]RWA60690.1 MAG: M48 family peptidase [Mesorhizobium sp.]RWB96751.1 MAG: M48 family peptidase [Mesorhizobium sp.]TIQ40549.1 MAG: M48 family metallopeptidase [Mesorhizobium sp.]
MPTLQIGRKQIPYELRRSAAASERRITVTPGHVEVLALTSDDDHDIAGFLERKRQWVFNTVREMERITSDRHAVPRFMTGSKILYRGRRMRLTVRRTDGDRIDLTFRNGFIVDLPSWAGSDADKLVARELKLWLKRRVRRDVKEIAADYSRRFGLAPRSIRVADFANGWGSCGAEGNILINWHLVFAPRKVLEYVIAHELAHLRHRSHGPAFWDFLRAIAPDFEASKAWLDVNQGSLSAEFLDS